MWSLGGEQLEASLGNASLHGTPVWFDGRVLLMARRSQMAGFQDSYLLAVNGRDGTVQWRRHLASTSGPGRRGEAPTLSRMTLHRGSVYFTDTLGVAARLDARRGTVRWVRLLVEGPGDEQVGAGETAAPLSDAADPLVCRAGLILPLRLGDTAGLLLAPDDGRVLRRWEQSDWPLDEVRYFLPVDGDVLAVGDRLARLDGRTLEPVWVQEESANVFRDSGIDGSAGGGVAVLGDRVLFPLAGVNNVIGTLDLATGEPRAQYEAGINGHLLAAGDAVVATDGERVAGFLDWEDAYGRLKQRLADDPHAYETALNMARLAVGAGRGDAVLEGVDAAMAALAAMTADGNRSETQMSHTRQRVVEELLRLTERPEALAPPVVEGLFQRLGATARTPGELVAFNLAFGRYQQGAGRLQEATAAFQSILADDALASAAFEQQGRSRRGDVAARQALVDLVEQHGPEAYAPFEDEARRGLARLRLSATPAAEDLLSLADRYPLAEASAEALFLAAEQQSRGDHHAAAVVPYRRAFDRARSDALRAEVAGALTRYYVEQGRPADAARWLAFVAEAAPDLRPMRDGAAVELRPWLAELEAAETAEAALPRLELPLGEPITLPGRPLVPLDDDAASAEASLVVLRDGGALSLYALPETTPRFTVKPAALAPPDIIINGLPDPNDPRLVDLGPDNFLLYSSDTGRLTCLDSRTGREAWPAADVAALLDEAGDRRDLAERRRVAAGNVLTIIQGDNQFANDLRAQRGQPVPPPTGITAPVVLASDVVVAVVDRNGRAVGIDRYSGRALWHFNLPVEAVTTARVLDDLLVVAGILSPDSDAQSAVLAAIDLATGRPRFPIREDPQDELPLRWVGANPDGNLLVLTDQQLALHGRDDGRPRWRIDLADLDSPPRPVPAGDTLFLVTAGQVLSVDARTGTLIHRGPRSAEPANATVQLLGHDGSLFLADATEMTARGRLGKLLWRDALADEPVRFSTIRLTADHVAALGFGPVMVAQATFPRPAALHLFEQDTGRLVTSLRLSGRPFNDQMRLHLLSNHLLIFDGEATFLVPGARR